MSSTKEICSNCKSNLRPENTLTVDKQKLCVDCATRDVRDIIVEEDVIYSLAEYLDFEDLMNLKKAIKGVSPSIDILIKIKLMELLDKNTRKEYALVFNLSGEDYNYFRLSNITTVENYEMFKENVSFFGNPNKILLDYFNGDYDFFDSDGQDYPTFAEMLEAEIGVDEKEAQDLQDYILSMSSGKLRTEVDISPLESSLEGLLIDVYGLILNNLVLEFDPESDRFYYYKVNKFIEKDKSIKVGDVVYAEEYRSSRPHYAIGLVGWDYESSKKILIIDAEGQPTFPQYIIDKLLENRIIYIMANDDTYFDILGGDETTPTDLVPWVLPNICMRLNPMIRD